MAFDISEPFRITIVSGDKKSCTVKYPTDADWCERTRNRKSVRQNMGRGKSRPVPIRSDDADLRLFERLRLDSGGAEFDASDAAAVIGKLDDCGVVEISREQGRFRMVLELGLRDRATKEQIRTVHFLRCPSKREQFNHERQSVDVVDGGRMREIRVALEPSGELYDKLVERTEGYAAAGVPVNHKFAVVFELMEEISRLESEDDDDPEA